MIYVFFSLSLCSWYIPIILSTLGLFHVILDIFPIFFYIYVYSIFPNKQGRTARERASELTSFLFSLSFPHLRHILIHFIIKINSFVLFSSKNRLRRGPSLFFVIQKRDKTTKEKKRKDFVILVFCLLFTVKWNFDKKNFAI